MKIIILEDLKGFRKVIDVAFFPPIYDIAELPPIKVKLFDNTKTYPDPTSKILRFYPKGEDIEYWWSSFGDVLNAVEDGDLALMQYTGLKDKNGKEIYEGDIVRSGNWIAEVPSINEFILQAMTYGQSMTDYTRTIVIGNIYENPELIK